MNRGLGRIQSVSVHKKLIPFGNAAEDFCVVENQTRSFLAGLLVEKQSRGKAGHSATHDDTIEELPGFVCFRWSIVELAVANCVRIAENSLGVSGRVSVIAFTRVAAPFGNGTSTELCGKGKWANSPGNSAS